MFKKIILATELSIAASATAWPQAAQFPSGYVQGNAGASAGQAAPSSVTAILDRALGSTRGSVIERGASGWAIVGPGSTSGLPWVSNGAGADPAYQALGVSGGGTGQTSFTAHCVLLGASPVGCLNGTVGNSSLPLLSQGASSDPIYGQLNLGTSVTGNLPVANLNSGTSASSTTFWRGDGTWASPSTTFTATLAPQGRLTLTSGVPVTTTDVTGATVVYYTPYLGRYVPLWNGSSNFIFTDTGGELSVTLGANWLNANAYDWFIGNNSGTIALCSGPAWSNSAAGTSARGTGAGTTQLTLLQGIYVNTVSMTCNTSNSTSFTCAASACTYVGTTLMVAAGQTTDSQAQRYVYNAYNQTSRVLLRQESTSSWTWSTASYHQVNASTANQLSYFAGLQGSPVRATAQCVPLNSTSTIRIVYCGIGLNSTTVNSKTMGDFCRIADGTVPTCSPKAFYDNYAALGLTNLVWLEKGAGTDTQTWFGNGGGTDFQAAITGEIFQ